MNYWLHRITGGDYALPVSSELYTKEYLSIGWCDFSNEYFLKAIKSGETAFNQMYMVEWGYLPRNRYNLWRFINSMKPGDYVIVPQYRSFSVCQIADDVIYTNESIDEGLLIDWNGDKLSRDDQFRIWNKDGKQVDLGFYRRIRFVARDIPRDYANQDLYSRMKIRQTNAHISDLGKSVEEAIDRFINKRPIQLRASILESTGDTVLNLIRKLYNHDRFEDLVEKYLYSIGADRVGKPSKNESPTDDGDADRVGYFDKLGVAIMVQAKKHTDKTDSWAVEQIKAYRQNHSNDDATILWVISTCDDYSEEAKRLAQEYHVVLINGKEFVEMLLDTGLKDLD